MKRGRPLARKAALRTGSPLERRTPLRSGAPPARSASLSRSARPPRGVGKARPPRREKRAYAPGRKAWFAFKRYGRCEACGKTGLRDPHHVLLEAYVDRIAPERVFDLANRWLIGRYCCHDGHHHPGVNDTRLPYGRIPAPAVAFVRELLGPAAERYFRARYRGAP